MYTYRRMPSMQKFHLIMEMTQNGEIITFREQTVYKCNRSFKKAMKELHDKGVVQMREKRTGNEYRLSPFGKNLGEILNGIAA